MDTINFSTAGFKIIDVSIFKSLCLLYGVHFAIMGHWQVSQIKADSKGCVWLYDCFANHLAKLDSKSDCNKSSSCKWKETWFINVNW